MLTSSSLLWRTRALTGVTRNECAPLNFGFRKNKFGLEDPNSFRAYQGGDAETDELGRSQTKQENGL
jgi:hypothetical protein